MNITIYDTREYRNETVVRRKKANPIKANNQLSACAIGMSFIMIYFNFIEEFTTLMGDGIIFLTYAFLSDIIRNRRENEYYRGVVLDPWLETAGVVLVAFVGIFLGKVFSCLRKSYWLLGYFLPFSLVIIMVLARSIDSLYFVWPFSWIVTGRVKFVVLCFAVSMGLTVPLSRLPRRCERILVCVLMISVVFWYTVLPFLVPALIREHLSNIQTRLSYNGVCFQSTDFTCGPAAAVTALGKLGLPAEEGELAVLSHTSPVAGTLPACLSSALKKRYGADGLKCRYRHFDSIDQLKKAGITLVMVRDSFLLDHCLAVMDVSDSTITIADPMSGLIKMPRERFKKIWRFSGIVLRRDRSQSI